MIAAWVMTKQPVAVNAETPISEIAELLSENQLSALPVTDAHQMLLGFVSAISIECEGLNGVARDIVQPYPAIVTPNTTLSEIRQVLEQHRIGRVPVAQDGKLVGIVSRGDFARVFAAYVSVDEAFPLTDDQIRARLLEALKEQFWLYQHANHIVVISGVVAFWGVVQSRLEFAKLKQAAESIPGVRCVRDHTVVGSVRDALTRDFASAKGARVRSEREIYRRRMGL
jgi:CBS domain-containing protein